MIQLNKNWWESLGHARAVIVVKLLLGACMVDFLVPSTFIAFRFADVSSIMFVVSGKISSLFS